MIVVLMGVAGVGKTTVGRALAAALGWRFVDADELHPTGNVEKMRSGRPLDERDRAPWLDALAAAIRRWLDEGADVVLACSALRAAHRARLAPDARVRFVHLVAPPPLLAARLSTRRDHFAGPSLLPSQLAALEPPGGATVSTDQPPDAAVAQIRALLSI